MIHAIINSPTGYTPREEQTPQIDPRKVKSWQAASRYFGAANQNTQLNSGSNREPPVRANIHLAPVQTKRKHTAVETPTKPKTSKSKSRLVTIN